MLKIFFKYIFDAKRRLCILINELINFQGNAHVVYLDQCFFLVLLLNDAHLKPLDLPNRILILFR